MPDTYDMTMKLHRYILITALLVLLEAVAAPSAVSKEDGEDGIREQLSAIKGADMTIYSLYCNEDDYSKKMRCAGIFLSGLDSAAANTALAVMNTELADWYENEKFLFSKAIHYREQSLRIYTALDSLDKIADTKYCLARLYYKKGLYHNALKYIYDALDDYTALGDKVGRAECYNIMGILYHICKDYEKSKACFSKYAENASELNDSLRMVLALNNSAAFEHAMSDSVKSETIEPPITDGEDTTTVTTPEEPSVILTEGPVSQTSISFTIIPENAEECAYLITEKEDGAEVPDAETIFKDGEHLEEIKSQLIEKDGMEAGTEYVVTAAVRNQDLTAVSEQLILKTDSIAQGTTMEVTISDVSATTSTITFTVTCANAGKAAYDVVEKGVEEHTPADVMYKGNEIPTQEPQTITVEGKKDNTTYVIYAVVEATDSYKRVMDTYEITTEKLPEPEETDVEKFTDGTIKMYGAGGRNYTITTLNEDYEIYLDFYCDEANAYMPYIASHEYTYEKAGSTSDWAIGTLTSITDLSSGSRLELEKGSFTSAMENGEYTIEGQFVTTDNVEFKFKITGSLQFNINAYYPSATASMTEDGISILFNLEDYTLSLLTQSQTVAGTYTVGGNILSESAFSIVSNTETFGLTDGNITIEDKGDDYYNVTASLVLEGGYPVAFKAEYLKIDAPDTPEDSDVIEFTSAEAQAYNDNTGYLTLYTIILENDEWNAQIEFAESLGEYDELPDGKWLYSSYVEGGDGMITQYRITNKSNNQQITDLDEGNMIISRNGSQYDINIDILRTGGESFKAHYSGSVVCEDMSGGYGY